jgi:hypothetical protein
LRQLVTLHSGEPVCDDVPVIDWTIIEDAGTITRLEIEAEMDAMEEAKNDSKQKPEPAYRSMDS